jgi:squalene-hopene/tetraprenyl-beta-curcumene cyclase
MLGMGGCLLAGSSGVLAAEPAAAAAPAISAISAPGESVGVSRAEIERAIERGITWLLANQNSNGFWSTADQPAVTALVLTALNKEPSRRFIKNRPSELSRAYEFLLGSVHPDGSIYRLGLANYNTSLALMALSTAEDPGFAPVIRQARRYLATTQIDQGQPGVVDTPFDGGVGYGSKYQHSDMNNTLTAIEAMRWSESATQGDSPAARKAEADLNWQAVAQFLQNCQNLPSHNAATWVSDNPKDRGGFVYYPGQSMAGGETNAVTGKVALRSYGSISYAGLLSYIYANVDRTDPRVVAVVEWLRTNYTVEENPGMGAQGQYYYLHLMTKALTAARIDRIRLVDGREVAWREEVAGKLLKGQSADGSWVNANPRWWETDKALVSAYALLTLEMIHAAPRGAGGG